MPGGGGGDHRSLETTFAEVFQSAGYATASIGKWPLGTEKYYPEKHGFDVNIAGTDKPQPPTYFAPWKIPTLTEGQNGVNLVPLLRQSGELRRTEFFLALPASPALSTRWHDALRRDDAEDSRGTPRSPA